MCLCSVWFVLLDVIDIWIWKTYSIFNKLDSHSNWVSFPHPNTTPHAIQIHFHLDLAEQMRLHRPNHKPDCNLFRLLCGLHADHVPFRDLIAITSLSLYLWWLVTHGWLQLIHNNNHLKFAMGLCHFSSHFTVMSRLKWFAVITRVRSWGRRLLLTVQRHGYCIADTSKS